MKAVKTYLGVKIFKFKDKVPGSDTKILKDGRFKTCSPKFETYYKYAGSYPYDTLKECMESIEECKNKLVAVDSFDQEVFEEIMNKGN